MFSKHIAGRGLAILAGVLIACAGLFGCGGNTEPESSATPSPSGTALASSEGMATDPTEIAPTGTDTDASGNPVTTGTGDKGKTTGTKNDGKNTTASKQNPSGGKNTTATTVKTLPPVTTGAPQKAEAKDLKGRKIRIAQNLATSAADYFQTVYGKKVQAHIKEIEDKYNCTIELQKIDYTALNTSVLAGDPICDIMDGGGPHNVAGFMNANMLLPLDQFQYINFKDARFDPFVTESLTVKGQHYGLQPVAQAFDSLQYAKVMFFNKSLLQRAGVTEDLYAVQARGEWTWSKLEEIAKKVTNASEEIWGIGDNQYEMYMNLVPSNGTDWVKNENGQIKFTAGEPDALEALNFYKKLAWDDKVMHVMTDIGADRNEDQNDFWAGKVAFLPSYLERIQRGFPQMKDDYGVLFIPKGPKAKDYVSSINWYSFFAIPSSVKEPNEVATILNAYCAPVLTEKEEASIQKVQLAALVRDQGSLDTINQLKSKMVRSDIFSAWSLHWTDDGWYPQLSLIAYNNLTPNNAVKQSTDAFNKKIADENKYLK